MTQNEPQKSLFEKGKIVRCDILRGDSVTEDRDTPENAERQDYSKCVSRGGGESSIWGALSSQIIKSVAET